MVVAGRRGGVLSETRSCHVRPVLLPVSRACVRFALWSNAVISIVPLHSGRALMATALRACTENNRHQETRRHSYCLEQ